MSDNRGDDGADPVPNQGQNRTGHHPQGQNAPNPTPPTNAAPVRPAQAQPGGPRARPRPMREQQPPDLSGFAAPNPGGNALPGLPNTPGPGNPAPNNAAPNNPAPWGAVRPQQGRTARPMLGAHAQQQPAPFPPPLPVAPLPVAPVPQQQPQQAPQQVPQQAPQQAQPARPAPPDMTGFQPKNFAQVDQVTLRVRRWSVSTLSALGMNSNSSQDRMVASTIATTARVDEAKCQPGVGPHCATALKATFSQQQLAADPPFGGLVGALETFENSSRSGGVQKSRGTAEVTPLRQAAAAFEQSLQGNNNADPNKLAALSEIKDVVRAFELRDQVTSYGQPPWDGQTAKTVAKAKIELDILSIPGGNQAPQPPPGGVGGVNPKFWIKRNAGTGANDDQGSFICKPAGDSTVDGIPPGGEAAREGLVHRAAALIGAKLGVQLNVPETHSIALDNSRVLPGMEDQNGTSTACSVQELRPNDGAIKGKSKQALGQVSKAQVHGLIALDICTLNLDRHSGNLLLAGNELIPIDHGASLPDPVTDEGTRLENRKGLARVRDAMPSTHNALLKFPQAHEPMDDAMRRQIKKMKPEAVRNELAQERDSIVQEMQAADGRLDQSVLSDAALATSQRAMEFMRIAASDFKDVSPASVQVALGKNAMILLDPNRSDKDFETFAKRFLNEAKADQPVTKQACLMNPIERDALTTVLGNAGWRLPMGGAAGNSIMCDPALALKIAMSGAQCPEAMQKTTGPKLPAPAPARGDPNPAAEQDMQRMYPRLKRDHPMFDRLHIDLGEEWAAHNEVEKIKQKSPQAWDELLTMAMLTTDRSILQPTAVLRALKGLEDIKKTIAQTEKQNGGPLQAVQAQLITFKVGVAQRVIGLLRGPLNQQFSQALAQARIAGLDMVTDVGDRALDRVQASLQREVATLRQANTITAQEADAIDDLVERGDTFGADTRLGNVPNYVRPNSV